MIDFISTWVQGIIVAVVIATIIEMIIPNGNSKKYIKMVIGIFIVFNIISPIINKFTGKSINFNDFINIEKYSQDISTYKKDTKNIENANNLKIKEVYISNLKNDIKAKIEDKGYKVNAIKIELEDSEEYIVGSVNMIITKNNTKENRIKEVEKINVQISNKDNNEDENEIYLNTGEVENIKEYIESMYDISKNKISIN